MMDICQSCLTSFEDDATKDVRFTIWEELNRQWYLCPDCAAKLRDMVLGFMGEQGPADTESDWVHVAGVQWYPSSEEPDEAGNTVPHKFQVAKCPGYVSGECEERISHLEGVSKLHCKPQDIPYGGCNSWRPSSEEPDNSPLCIGDFLNGGPKDCDDCDIADSPMPYCRRMSDSLPVVASETTVGPAPGTVYQTTINGHKANVLIVEYPESEVDKIC